MREEQTTQQLWDSYRGNQNSLIRQELMVRYLGLVKYVVRKMIKSFPQAIEEAEDYPHAEENQERYCEEEARDDQAPLRDFQFPLFFVFHFFSFFT